MLQCSATGNKEWTADLPDEEEVQAIAAGTTFVAVATNARTLRLFMPGGTQREVISLPGPIVAMNALGNNLAVVYHSSLGDTFKLIHAATSNNTNHVTLMSVIY